MEFAREVATLQAWACGKMSDLFGMHNDDDDDDEDDDDDDDDDYYYLLLL